MGEILVSNRRAASTHSVHFAPVQSPRHFSRFSRQSSPVAISSRVRVEATFHGLHLVCFEHHTGERHIARLERHEGRLQDTVSASPSPNHPSRYYIVTRRFAPDRGINLGRCAPGRRPRGAARCARASARRPCPRGDASFGSHTARDPTDDADHPRSLTPSQKARPTWARDLRAQIYSPPSKPPSIVADRPFPTPHSSSPALTRSSRMTSTTPPPSATSERSSPRRRRSRLQRWS